MWREFKAFLIKENVLALAVAVVIGTALSRLVAALVADLIMPIVSAAVPSGDWKTATVDVGSIRFLIGDFAGALIDFVIIAFVAWRISKAFIKPAAAPAPTQICPYCRMNVDSSATRCSYCTSQLGAAA